MWGWPVEDSVFSSSWTLGLKEMWGWPVQDSFFHGFWIIVAGCTEGTCLALVKGLNRSQLIAFLTIAERNI